MAENSTLSKNDDNIIAAVATIPLIGLIMYFAVNNLKPLPKFYAKQSIGLTALGLLQTIIFFFRIVPVLGFIFDILYFLLGLLVLVTWIILLIKALQGEMYRMPILADTMDQIIK